MFKKSSEEINLDRYILKFINDLQDTASGVIDVKQIAISEEQLKYQSADIYIENINNFHFDQGDYINMKRQMNISKNSVRYIEELNYIDILNDKESLYNKISRVLHFSSDLNMIPIFKIKTQRYDIFTSTEKMALNMTLEMLFIMLR